MNLDFLPLRALSSTFFLFAAACASTHENRAVPWPSVGEIRDLAQTTVRKASVTVVAPAIAARGAECLRVIVLPVRMDAPATMSTGLAQQYRLSVEEALGQLETLRTVDKEVADACLASIRSEIAGFDASDIKSFAQPSVRRKFQIAAEAKGQRIDSIVQPSIGCLDNANRNWTVTLRFLDVNDWQSRSATESKVAAR